MTTAVTPLPGDWFVVDTTGSKWWTKIVSALIRWGEATKVHGRWVDGKVTHAGVFVGVIPGRPGSDWILEAQPQGSVLSHASQYPGAIWSTGRLPAHLVPTPEMRAMAPAVALSMVGIPYGFLDYLAIILAQSRFGRRVDVRKPMSEQPWFVRRLESMKTAICSQLVDLFEQRLGIQLWSDGRIPGLVSPADLLALLTP